MTNATVSRAGTQEVGIPVFDDPAAFPTDGSVLLAFFEPGGGKSIRDEGFVEYTERVLCVYQGKVFGLQQYGNVGVYEADGQTINYVDLPLGWFRVKVHGLSP